LIIKSLDDAAFLKDVDRLVGLNFGLALYSGLTGAQRALESLNFACFGLEHTGQLGDVVVGSYLRSPSELHDVRLAGLYSHRLADKVDRAHLADFQDRESYMLYTRGFSGILSTHLVRQNYTEVASPFLDVDFLEFALSVPIEMRAGHGLYKKWVMSKYPSAAQFRWEKTNARLCDPDWLVFMRRAQKALPSRIERLTGRPSRTRDLGRSMNPFEYWYHHGVGVRSYMDDYFAGGLDLGFSPELRADLLMLYREGTVQEKTMVLTVVGAARVFALCS
jgi:asparagine synthase (glutamine-hydrolysing)